MREKLSNLSAQFIEKNTNFQKNTKKYSEHLWSRNPLKIIFQPLISTQVPQDVRSFGMANITGIVLPYFRLCLLIVHSAAPDLNSTNEGPIAPITPFPSGEETIWPAYKLSDMDGRAGPEIKEIRVLVKMFLMHILHNVTILYLNYYLSFDVCACFRLSVFLQKKFFVQNGSNSQIRWTDISNSRIQARRAWRLVFYI